MYIKLAFKNIRRSFGDYAIYFFTLLFGVGVFFAFNSIGSQRVLFDLQSRASFSIFNSTEAIMRIFSILIAGVLAFLIIYANRFLIKRRKREFGTYLLLGMRPGTLSKLVLYETLIVGIFSLAAGLALGIALAQGLSFATAMLFGIVMDHYAFVFSFEALVMTLICFAVIYAIVAVFNVFTVRNVKLISLFQADARVQRDPVRKPLVSGIVWIISVGILVSAYVLLIDNGMVDLAAPEFLASTILMLVGTLLFFWSVASLFTHLVTHARSFYLRKLRPFTTRQIASRINTAFLSIWFVCVMLFFSITTFSVGMGFVNIFTGDIDKANPYDLSLRADYVEADFSETSRQFDTVDGRLLDMQSQYPQEYADMAAYSGDLVGFYEDRIPRWNDVVEEASQIDFYTMPGATYAMLLDAVPEADKNLLGSDALTGEIGPSPLQVISVGQLNALREMRGEDTVEIDAAECLIANNSELTEGIADALANNRASIDLYGAEYSFVPPVCEDQLQDMAMLSTYLIVVLPDEAVDRLIADGAIPLYSYVNIDFKDPRNGDDEFTMALIEGLGGIAFVYTKDGEAHTFDSMVPKEGETLSWAEALDLVETGEATIQWMDYDVWPISSMISGAEMKAQSGGLRMLITYLAIYIGFVLLIATAAILAIQQLSETADSLGRYRVLFHLGCDEGMLSRSLLMQVFVYFLAPLALAVVHSAVAISVVESSLFEGFGISSGQSILMAALLVVIVYGGYMAVTFIAAQRMVASSLKERRSDV